MYRLLTGTGRISTSAFGVLEGTGAMLTCGSRAVTTAMQKASMVLQVLTSRLFGWSTTCDRTCVTLISTSSSLLLWLNGSQPLNLCRRSFRQKKAEAFSQRSNEGGHEVVRMVVASLHPANSSQNDPRPHHKVEQGPFAMLRRCPKGDRDLRLLSSSNEGQWLQLVHVAHKKVVALGKLWFQPANWSRFPARFFVFCYLHKA